MPFTFSHPAAILPFAILPKRWVSLTALVIGSMTPDFEYFIRFRQDSSISHTWPGVLKFDLPIGLLLILLFNVFIRQVLIDHLPLFLNKRFSNYRLVSGNIRVRRSFFIVLASLLIGVISHLCWDRLTHKSAFWIDENDPFDVYSSIWNINSIIGAALLAWAIKKMPKRSITQKPFYLLYWFFITGLMVILLIKMRIQLGSLRDMAVSVISVFFIVLLAVSAAYKLYQKFQTIFSGRFNNIK